MLTDCLDRDTFSHVLMGSCDIVPCIDYEQSWISHRYVSLSFDKDNVFKG